MNIAFGKRACEKSEYDDPKCWDRLRSNSSDRGDLSIHVMSQIFKSGDLSNLIRSFDSISGGFLSNYFNAR